MKRKGSNRKRNSYQAWPVRYSAIFILGIAILAGVMLLYSQVTGRVIDASIQSMEELALHDEKAIMASVESRWNILAGIGEECRQMRFDRIQDVLSLLRVKEDSLNCLDLALVDENEDIYFGAQFISRDENITDPCRTGQDRFAIRYDGAGQNADTKRECLLFGARITPFTVEGKTFTYVVCRFHIDTICEELKIDSYDGAGYSSVIDLDGNYIVNMNRSHSVQERSNFYTDLESYVLADDAAVDDVRENIRAGGAFTLSCKTETGENLMRFTPMDEIDWYFVMSVSKSVFEGQSMGILRIVFLAFVAIGAAGILILGLVLHSRHAVSQARLEQSYREELSEALAMAEQASKAKTVFLNNMSHDIRTPMNAIIGFTNLAIARIDDKAQVKDYLTKIERSSNHLLSLINDVLDMSRIESGKMVIEEKPENLAEVFNNINNIINNDIHSRHLKLCVDAVNVMDEDVLCDRLRLNQVLLNLLSNAMKFTPPGGTVSVMLRQLPGREPGFGTYELRVRDTGIGMSPEFAATIFEPFTRERTSTVSGIQGTGLGMSITKNIVDMMGGQIRVYSEPGKGTEFILSFTFRLQDLRGDAAEGIACLAGVRALVADDTEERGRSIRQMLLNIGLRAEWVGCGKAALDHAREAGSSGDCYAVYIIDEKLPDLDSAEVVRQIRQSANEEAPVILLARYDRSDEGSDASEADVTGYIGKPVFQSELRRTLAEACGMMAEESAEATSEGITFAGRRILLVEDNELNREIATEILQDAGFAVETAENGQEAVDAVRQSVPGYFDLVLMDIQMPVMGGYEASRAIRALEDPTLANILIIAMTANAFEEDKRNALDAGMNAHVGKPIDIPALMDTLKQFLL